MSFRRPNSLTLKARNPPIAINTVCKEIAKVRLNSQVVGIQRIRQGEWCVTLKTKEAADLAQTAFAEHNDMALISERLKVNEQGTCRLEGVPVEYANANIYKSLCEFFEGLAITDEVHKNLPEGFPPVKTGNRLLKYDKIRKQPDKRVYLGMGVSGYLNDLERKNIEEAHITCQNCASESHITRLCGLPTKCKKCGGIGHKKDECEREDCRRCQSGFHSTELCPRNEKICENCEVMGHIGRECNRNMSEPDEEITDQIALPKHSIIFVKETLSDTLFQNQTTPPKQNISFVKETASHTLPLENESETEDKSEGSEEIEGDQSVEVSSIISEDLESEDNTVDKALENERMEKELETSEREIKGNGREGDEDGKQRKNIEGKKIESVEIIEKGKRNRDKISQSTDEGKDKKKSKKKKDVEKLREDVGKEKKKDISVEEIDNLSSDESEGIGIGTETDSSLGSLMYDLDSFEDKTGSVRPKIKTQTNTHTKKDKSKDRKQDTKHTSNEKLKHSPDKSTTQNPAKSSPDKLIVKNLEKHSTVKNLAKHSPEKLKEKSAVKNLAKLFGETKQTKKTVAATKQWRT